jgi:hypothetical protein
MGPDPRVADNTRLLPCPLCPLRLVLAYHRGAGIRVVVDGVATLCGLMSSTNSEPLGVSDSRTRIAKQFVRSCLGSGVRHPGHGNPGLS